jgi:hypothetical protein
MAPRGGALWSKGNGGEAGCPVAVSAFGGVGEHHGGREKPATPFQISKDFPI